MSGPAPCAPPLDHAALAAEVYPWIIGIFVVIVLLIVTSRPVDGKVGSAPVQASAAGAAVRSAKSVPPPTPARK